MGYAIRPLSVAEILAASLQMLQSHTGLLVGVSAALYVPFGLSLGYLDFSDPAAMARARPWLFVGALSFLAALPVMQVAFTVAISEIYTGERAEVGPCYRNASRILVPAVGTYAVFLGVMLATLSLPWLAGGPWWLAPLLALPSLALALRGWMLPMVMAVEREFGVPALRRAWTLSGGHSARILATFLPAFAGGLVVFVALEFLWVSLPGAGPLFSAVTLAFVAAYGTAAAVLLYFDLRCRAEAFNLSKLCDQVRAAGAGS